jgi:hypothetical protein
MQHSVHRAGVLSRKRGYSCETEIPSTRLFPCVGLVLADALEHPRQGPQRAGGQRSSPHRGWPVAPFRSPFAFALFVLWAEWLLFEPATAIRPALTTVCGAWLTVRTSNEPRQQRKHNAQPPQQRRHNSSLALCIRAQSTPLARPPHHPQLRGTGTSTTRSVPPRSAVRALLYGSSGRKPEVPSATDPQIEPPIISTTPSSSRNHCPTSSSSSSVIPNPGFC